MSKKIFIISAVFFIVALGALIAHEIFLNGASDEKGQEEQTQQVPQEQQEEALKGKISLVIDQKTLGATLADSLAQLVFYSDNKFLQAGFEGKIHGSIGQYPFKNVTEIYWNKKKDKAIIRSEGKLFVFDLNANVSNEMRSGIDHAIWDEQGDRIVYKYYDNTSGKRSIDYAKENGTDWSTLFENIPWQKVELITSSIGNSACYYPLPGGSLSGRLECVDLYTRTKKIVHQGEFGAEYLFSPDGKKILTSYTKEQNQNKLVLGVMNDNGGELKGLNFMTSIKKCVWSGDNIHVFCGQMNDIPEHAVLPDDWQEGKYKSTDTFWKINTENGKKERLVELQDIPGKLDTVGYFLDKMENNLFFTDKTNGKIYRIELKE